MATSPEQFLTSLLTHESDLQAFIGSLVLDRHVRDDVFTRSRFDALGPQGRLQSRLFLRGVGARHRGQKDSQASRT